MAVLLLHVDDMILSASSNQLLQYITQHLRSEFAVKDIGPLRSFLGVDITRTSSGFFLSQAAYAEEILDRAGMANCKAVSTLVDTKSKLPSSEGEKIRNASAYRSIAGVLQYLTITRPDIAYALQQACLHMHDPRECHFNFVKRILRYIRGSTQLSLHLRAVSRLDITAYSEAGCPDTHRSTSGYCIYLGDSLVSWSSQRQATVPRSCAKAEYRAIANAAAECIWLRQLPTTSRTSLQHLQGHTRLLQQHLGCLRVL
jgi:hypothetical protein